MMGERSAVIRRGDGSVFDTKMINADRAVDGVKSDGDRGFGFSGRISSVTITKGWWRISNIIEAAVAWWGTSLSEASMREMANAPDRLCVTGTLSDNRLIMRGMMLPKYSCGE